MFFTSVLYFSFVVVTFFNEFQWVNSNGNCTCPDDLTDGPNIGPEPPLPRENGSRVPSDWQWIPVPLDDLLSNDPDVRHLAQSLLLENTMYSLLYAREIRARRRYYAKEREHIRNKQLRYNEFMKEQWKKDRMNSLPWRCTILRR
ncbi:unnamed protein product [Rotaria sp. Silwood2]|nr:unnamed protein product [Rotaria sp. Silwood2]CAF2786043.1 unnamed protein product [Rotaria sp. Silwood2]CAF3245167.1 unnamed protein product [Rotaria sp. Silwood2]CAF3333407.1 unnamed protein product [Rotaria sp. Silwood2]CAF4101097.1 unnamed protein product [Rotaria sp. Silwood2]